MIKATVEFIQHLFFLVIDISGTIFGAILIYIGWRLKSGDPLPLNVSGWIIFSLGLLSFSIHGIHYVWARVHGSDYFVTTRKKMDQETNK